MGNLAHDKDLTLLAEARAVVADCRNAAPWLTGLGSDGRDVARLLERASDVISLLCGLAPQPDPDAD